jgi:hypothetical protein
MQKTIPLFLILLLGIVGCGVQRGRFVTTSNEENPLLDPIGCIDIIDGYEKQPDHEADALSSHLLFMLIVTPGVQEHGSSSSSDFGEYVTTENYSWNTDKGTFSVSIPWNRQTDVVTVGKQDFIRKDGDVFIIRINENGEISGQQLPSLIGPARSEEVLKYIQKQLPEDKMVASIKLNK